MVNTTPFEPISAFANAYGGVLRGVSTSVEVRLLAPANAPMTGEVRPQAADDVQTAHFGNGIKDGVRVRTWRPPV